VLNPELKFNFIIELGETPIVDDKIIHNKNSRRNKIRLSKDEYQETTIKWTLFEFSHKNDEHFGMPWSSSKSLNNGLSASSILKYLNSNLVFDFYQLKENDKLNIRMEYIHREMHKPRPIIDNYLSFVFKEEWKLNKDFETIDYSYRELKNGELVIC
jgi:hypothetical protein